MTYKQDMHNYTINLGKQTDEVVRGTLFDLSSAIIKDTPVDTGRLRGNWMASVNKRHNRTTKRTDSTGNSTIGQISQDIQLMGLGHTFYLMNNLPYAERIEYGYSGQAPQGMVRKNIARLQSMLDRQSKRIK